MTKKLIAIICFAVAIGVAGIFESRYIIKSFGFMEESLATYRENIQKNPEQIDTQENIDYMENLHAEWQKRTKVLKFFVWHTGIKDVEVGLSRITSYSEENNYTEAYVELNNLVDYCMHYSEDYRFSIQNVI